MGQWWRGVVAVILLGGWLQAGEPLDRCLDWMVLDVEGHVWTWKFYLYWHTLVTQSLDPAAARKSYQTLDAVWQQFVRDMATIIVIERNGFERPHPAEVDQILETLVRQYPWAESLDPRLLREVVEHVVWIHTYRDRIFRSAIVVTPDEVQAAYERRYPNPNERPSLEQVYDRLVQALVDERLQAQFTQWQTRILDQLTWHVIPIPTSCEEFYDEPGENPRRQPKGSPRL